MGRTKELLDEILDKQKELLALIDEFEGISTIGIHGRHHYKQIHLVYSQDLLTLAKLYEKQIKIELWYRPDNEYGGQYSFDADDTKIFALYDEEEK